MHHPEKKDSFFEGLIVEIVSRLKKELAQPNRQPDFLSVRTISQILDCSPSEVRKKIQENGIPTVPFGRGYRVDRLEFERRLDQWRKGGELWD